MNPYSLIALTLSVLLFFKGKKAFGSFYWRISINIFTLCECRVLPILLRFLTFSTLNQAGNVESMGGAVGASFKWYDFVYFIDTIIYLIILILNVIG